MPKCDFNKVASISIKLLQLNFLRTPLGGCFCNEIYVASYGARLKCCFKNGKRERFIRKHTQNYSF